MADLQSFAMKAELNPRDKNIFIIWKQWGNCERGPACSCGRQGSGANAPLAEWQGEGRGSGARSASACPTLEPLSRSPATGDPGQSPRRIPSATPGCGTSAGGLSPAAGGDSAWATLRFSHPAQKCTPRQRERSVRGQEAAPRAPSGCEAPRTLGFALPLAKSPGLAVTPARPASPATGARPALQTMRERRGEASGCGSSLPITWCRGQAQSGLQPPAGSAPAARLVQSHLSTPRGRGSAGWRRMGLPGTPPEH